MEKNPVQRPEDFETPNQRNGRGNNCQGRIQTFGELFQFTVDVSEFAPEDVVVTSSNDVIKVCAEKVGEDGRVTNTFSQKCQFPVDVDPMSVTSSMGNDGVVVVKACRQC